MKRIFLCCLLACLPTALAAADEALPAPVNLGFETGTLGVAPPGWAVSSGGMEAALMEDGCPEGTHCVRLTRRESSPGAGALVQVIRADAYRAKRVLLRAALRKTSGEGRALLYFQTNRVGATPDSIAGRAAGIDWRVDELITDVPKDADTLQFGLLESGAVEGWLDAVTIEILGEAGLGNGPPRPLSVQGAGNLAALARLVERVRYFHPSDQSAQLDWATWSVNAIEPVEAAKDTAGLVRALDRLIRPLAPTARVFKSGGPPARVEIVTGPNARPIAWRHYGLGTGSQRARPGFSSRRLGGFEKPEGSGEATWIFDAADLRGASLRLSALTRVDFSGDLSSRGELSMSVTDRDGRTLAEERRSIGTPNWQETSIELSIPMNAGRVFLGGRLSGGGRLFLDEVHVTATALAAGPSREVLADGFERDTLGGYPEGWFVSPASRAAGYRIGVSDERPGEGRRCLEVAWDLDAGRPTPASPPVVELGGGASARIPVVLFADPQGTLPHEAGDRAFESHKPRGFLPSGKDRATRLADVVLLWAALDGFYPYRLPADWSSRLDRALKTAAEDKDERSFLETLRRLIAGLADDHATVSHPSDRSDHRLPLLWSWLKGRVVVTWADSSQVRAGDVVEEVDGKPVVEVLSELEASISAATPAYRRYRALELLAAGPSGASRSLRLRRGAETFAITLRATAPLLGSNRLRGKRPEKVAELRPGLFYLDLDRIDDEDFESALSRLQGAKGLIFDVRGYPERISEKLLAHLISAPVRTAGTWTAIRTRPDREPKLDHLSWTIQPLAPRLTARAVFLTDERAYSRAETYLDIVSFYHLGAILGRQTGGTDGEVNDMDLPGGYHVTWTGSRVERLNGTELQGVGISPTIEVVPTLAGVEASRDEALDRAVVILEEPQRDGRPSGAPTRDGHDRPDRYRACRSSGTRPPVDAAGVLPRRRPGHDPAGASPG